MRYMYDGRELESAFKDYHNPMEEQEMSIKRIRNGIILPVLGTRGGILDENREYVFESSYCTHKNNKLLTVNGAYPFDTADNSHADKKVIFLGYYCSHWGHFLLDCVSRFWIINMEEYKEYQVVFLAREGHTFGKNHLRFMELAGLDERRWIKISKPSSFAEILIPSLSNDSKNRCHAKMFGDIFKTVADRAEYDENSVPKKVYFSRRFLFAHTEYGEREIEENFARNGFTVCYPEKMTLDDQIAIYRHADIIACQNSSLGLNVVFSDPKVRWIIINKSFGLHEVLVEFQHIVPVKAVYIDGYSEKYASTIGKAGGVFYLYLNRYMKRFFRDEGMRYKSLGYGYVLSNIFHSVLRVPYHSLKIDMLKYSVLSGIRSYLIQKNPALFYRLKRLRDRVKKRGQRIMR